MEMSDGLQRRALLEQVGEALRAVTGKSGKGPGSLAVKAVAGHDASALQVAQAYASWPTLLLAETVDHEALAKSVVVLFKGQQKEWAAYLKVVRKDVPGFGEGVTVEAEAKPVEVAAAEQPAEPAKHSKPKAEKKGKHADNKGSKKKLAESPENGAEVEAAANQAEPATPTGAGEAGTAESNSFLSPNWPWKAEGTASAAGVSQ
jgi:hypothetical protein